MRRQFDGLAGAAMHARDRRTRWRRRGRRLDPALREALRDGCGADSRVCGAATAGVVERRLLHGLMTGQLVRPLGAVGCYVPSGRHPLPSTLLMTAIPAQVAGVERIVVVFAEARAARRWPRRICWASRSSIDWAARTPWRRWPTELRALPRVDKIVGPGNLYVTAAKRLVAFDCAIDMLAGPTEIVVTSERRQARRTLRATWWRRQSTIRRRWRFLLRRVRSLAKDVIAEDKAQPRECSGAGGAASATGW